MRAIAAASDLPVVVYDIPVRTGRKIATATLLRLFREVPNIVALKDAAGNPGETAALISSAPAGFEVYSGDDAMTLPLLAGGIVGAIGVATHWTGEDHQEMFDLWEKGDTVGARLVNSRHARELRVRDRRRRPEPDPDQGDDAPPRPRRSARPGCRWATPRRSSSSERPRCGPTCNDGAMHFPTVRCDHRAPMADPVRIVFLGGLGEIGRNCMAIEQRGPRPADRLRADVPRCRHARHRPRAARLHLPARERRPHRRRASPPTATRTTSARCTTCCAS